MNAERMSWVMNMDAENYVLSCEKGTRFEAFVFAVQYWKNFLMFMHARSEPLSVYGLNDSSFYF